MSAEAVVFADGIMKDSTELPVIGKIKHNGNQVSLQAKCVKRIVKAELCYTTDRGKHPDRLWKSIPANIYDETISASLPESFTAFFFNATSEENLMLSSKYIEKYN